MKARRVTDDQVRAAYASRRTLARSAKRLGVSPQALSYHAPRLGLTLRRAWTRPQPWPSAYPLWGKSVRRQSPARQEAERRLAGMAAG